MSSALLRRTATVVTVVGMLVSSGVQSVPAEATGGGGGHTGGSHTSCNLYPIGVESSTISAAVPGRLIRDLTTGTPPGHEGWLTWAGGVSEGTLARSLTPPGDSARYVNPDDRSDHVLSIGDWVSARPGAVSSRGVREALGELTGTRIVVPVWDSSRGKGRNVAYHVTGFAEVEITSYQLHHDNRISAKYRGESTCVTPSNGPVAQPASATTPEDTPTRIVLTGTNEKSTAPLVFAVGAPAAGTAALVAQPVCHTTTSDDDDDDDDDEDDRGRDAGHQSWSSRWRSGRDGHDKDPHPEHGSGEGGTTCTAIAEYRPAADFNGSDSFTFTVSDGRSASAPATVSITVTAVNDPPVAGADSGSTNEGTPFTVTTQDLLANDVAGPADEASQHLTVAAISGAETHGTVELAGGTVVYTPAIGFSGTVTFTYSVCDDGTTGGQTDPKCATGLLTVTVSPAGNEPPLADQQAAEVAEDAGLDLTLTGSDADGDALVYAIVASPAHGTVTGTRPDVVYTPKADYFGPDEFTFTVSDGQATSEPATVSITVTEVNDPPLPGADSVAMPAGETTLSIGVQTLLANDRTGPANESDQSLAVTAVSGGPDTHGTVTLAGKAITFVPDPGFSGSATFGYTVCDDGTTHAVPAPLCADTGFVTVNLAKPNEPPVADEQSVTIVEDGSLPIVLTGSDPENSPITFAIATQPPNGGLVGPPPTVTYAPTSDFFGPDAFTFTVSDGQAASIPATVSITVTEVNDPPTAGAESISVPGRFPSAISSESLLANDTAGPSNEATQTIAITSVTQGAGTHGTVTLANGIVTFTPDLTFVGVATFTYTVCDNGTTAGRPDPLCSDGQVSVAVAGAPNQQPIADPGSFGAREDTATPLVLDATDADGDPITFQVISQPTHGTLSGTLPELTYTPVPDYFGPDQITFIASDAFTASVPAVVSIDVDEVNDEPVAGPDVVVALAGQPLGLAAASLLANDQRGPSNENGQTLTLTNVAAGADTHGAVSVAEGTITYLPDPSFVGPASFTYTACDNGTTESLADPRCAPGQVTVTLAEANRPPIAQAASTSVAEDHSVAIALIGSDPEGAPITYAVVAPPRHGALTGTAPQLTYTPAPDYFGPDEFAFTTSDGLATSSPASVSITVTEVNDPPRLGADTYTLGGAGTLPPPPPAPRCGDTCGVIFGDPHVLSFDEAGYDVQAVGELIVAKSTTDDFEVQGRFTAVPRSRIVSIDTALAMRVAGHRVSMYRTTTGLETRLDGVPITVPATPRALPGGGTIGTYGLDQVVIVVWPDGSVAIVRAVGVYPEYYRFTLELGLAPARLGRVVGLLGDANGNQLDDLVTRAGQPIAWPDPPFALFYGTYVNSWRISNAESMFDYRPGETTETFTDLTFPDAPATPQSLPAGARTTATNTCNLFGLTTQALSNACIVDVGTTGDADFANSAANAQQAGLGIPTNAGPTSIGTASTITTTTPGEVAVRTFPTTSAGGRVTLSVSGNTFVGGVDLTIRDANGTTVGSLFVSQPTGFRDVFVLPVAGTYTITIDPRDQQTGSLTFLLAGVPENTGTTAIGSATSVSTTVVGENAVRSFSATAGQLVTLSVSGNTFLGGVDLTVRNPSNGVVGSLFVSQPTGFRDVFVLPVAGTYTITIDPRDQQTGSLTFLLAAVQTIATIATTERSPVTLTDRVDKAGAGDADAVTADRISALVDAGAGDAGAALLADATPELTIAVADLLANDRPGPDNESSQSLSVTDVSTSPLTHGTVTFAAGVITYVPDANFLGASSFVYTACDDGTTAGAPDPLCSTIQVVVIVTANRPPVVIGQTITTAEETPVPITLTGNDPDGDPIVFVVGAPARGQITGAPPAITYTPAPDANGVDTFTFTANDGHDPSLPATVTINVAEVNDPPVARPDTATNGAGQPTTVTFAKLLANDGPGPFDERNQTLTVSAVTPGPDTHGSIQTSATSLTYSPDAGFDGTAVIAYTVCDNGTTNGNPDPKCADSTISIGHNRAPSANPQSAQTSRTAPVDLTLTATDPEGDALTSAIAISPLHGTLSGTAPAVRYRASAGFIGTDTFTFTASDAFSTSSPATVTITVNDVPSPTLAPDSATTQPGSSVLIAVLANDTSGSGALDPATMAIAAAPGRGVAAVEGTKIRYTPNAGQTGTDSFSYTVCDTGGGCATAQVSIVVSENHAPVAIEDSFDVNTGTTLNVAAPGVLTNDSDQDTGDRIQARLVRGVTNGNLLLYGTGAFTYTPHGAGIDTFVYHLVDRAGLVSNDVTVTLVVSGPPGPPIVGNNLYEVQQGRELTVGTPGVLANDYSPNPRLALSVLLQRDAAKGSLVLQTDGSFVYTPLAGYTGIDQFSYVVRDSQGRVSQEGRVGITVTAGGPQTATIGSPTPADGSVVTGPTRFTATLVPPAGESVSDWTVSYRQPGGATLIPLGSGSGTDVAANFDPTLVRNGTYSIVVRAVTSGGGVLVSETGLIVDGDYKPGRYTTTYRDAAVNSANIPIDLLRSYDSTDKAGGDFGPGWSLAVGGFKVESNGPLGTGRWTTFTCGSFPFLATCYQPSKPHIVTVTWPDGHVERFRFTPNQGSQLVPTITTAGFTAEPGTTSTLQSVGAGLLLSGGDFLLGDFFSADGIYDPVQFVLTDRSGVRYRIDKRAGLLSITDRNGNIVNLGDDGFLSSTGLSMSFVRDASNRITRVVAPGGNIDYSYGAAGDLVRVSYPNGTQQTFTYDAQHNLLSTGGGGQLVRTLHYDTSGRLTSITDGSGNTTTINSNVAGHQVVETDASGQLTTVITYDDRGNEIQRDRIAGGQTPANTIAGNTITTSATYDSFDRQLSTTDGLGHRTTRTYDVAGNVLTVSDPNGNTTAFTYNSFGQLLSTTDPLGHRMTNAYDNKGNLTSTTTADGKTTTHTYGSDGNLLTTTDPMGRVTSRTYDSNGYLARITDPGGNVTRQAVNPSTGLLTSVTDPTGATTSYGYDAVGNLTSITDANGHTRSAAYDAFDRIVSLTDPTGATTNLAYDSRGNLTSVNDRNGQTITYSYDAKSRLLSKNVPAGGITTFTYDAYGRLTGGVNAVAELAFTYDAADHVLTATSTPAVANAMPTSTFTYTYDAAGNVTSRQGPGGRVGYSYDAGSQLTSITDPTNGAFLFGYDPVGHPTTLTRPNGINDSMTYDAAGDIATLRSTLGATLVNQADYTYYAAGPRASITSLLGSTTYTYDGASQLTSATPPAGSGLPLEQYTYDPVGNRISSATSPLGSFSYNSGDRLLGDATTAYTYDQEGNLLTRTDKASGARTTYTWTAEHQLVGIAFPDNSSSTLRYDPLGRRVEIADGSSVTRYAFDRQAIAAEYDATNALTANYVGPVGACPLEMVRDGARYFYVTDGRQSTTELTNISGAVVTSYRYQAFGIPLRIGNLENPFEYLCLWVYGVAGLGFPSSGPFDPGSGQFLNDNPIEFPNPNPFQGGNPMLPPGGAGGGGADESAGQQCAGGKGPQIYPKGWKGLGKGAKKLMAYPKRQHPKKGAGTEYVGLLPTQETVQTIADYGFILRCQIATAANSLGP